jgi:large repetitive protein
MIRGMTTCDRCYFGLPRLRTLSALAVLGMAALWLGNAGRAGAAIDPFNSVTNWAPILWGNPEPGADQQTGSSEADIVGTSAQASFYSLFSNNGTSGTTDDQWGFRLRLAAERSPSGFNNIVFVGLDANLDRRLDLFIGVDNQGSTDRIRIWAPDGGTGMNVSPNTISINSTPLFSYVETGANYSWMVVNSANDPLGPSYNIDGASGAGETDRFLSFILPMSDVISAMATVGISGFSTNSSVNYIVGTSTQVNSINQDLNGVNGGINSSTDWLSLGVLSGNAYSPSGVAVPEPQIIALLAISGLALAARRLRALR